MIFYCIYVRLFIQLSNNMSVISMSWLLLILLKQKQTCDTAVAAPPSHITVPEFDVTDSHSSFLLMYTHRDSSDDDCLGFLYSHRRPDGVPCYCLQFRQTLLGNQLVNRSVLFCIAVFQINI